MNVANPAWALGELATFISITELVELDDAYLGLGPVGSHAQIVSSAEVVERILDRVLPDWPSRVRSTTDEGDWAPMREAAQRAQVVIVRQAEIDSNLGDDAPQLSASSMHPWVWSGARSLWQSRHYREAVGAAARKVNAETQTKLGGRKLSEGDLFVQAFSDAPPKPGEPRLRIVADDGSRSFRSLHRGARDLASGWFAGVRNPVAHDDEDEIPEVEALEQLAVLSLLARWVDRATVETA